MTWLQKLHRKCLLRQDLLRDPSDTKAVLMDRLIKDVIHRNLMPIDSLCLKVQNSSPNAFSLYFRHHQ